MRSDDWDYRAFVIKHGYDVKSLLLAYSFTLIRAIAFVWDKIEWKEKKVKNSYKIPFKDEEEKDEIVSAIKKNTTKGRNAKFTVRRKWVEVYYETKRLMPKIPASKEFKRALRDRLMKDWDEFAAHYVDSAIKQTYSMLKSWSKNYRKGNARKRKPVIRRRFVRIKETLFTYRDNTIRISIKPYKEYIEFLIPEWMMAEMTKFLGRKPEKADFGELILKEDELVVVVRKAKRGYGRKIAIDTNMNSIDGFDPANGFFTRDISEMRRIAEAYDEQITRLQSYERKKPSLRKKKRKLIKRRNCRIDNEANLKANELVNEYKGCLFVFEDLNKRGMFKNSLDKSEAKRIIGELKDLACRIQWKDVKNIIDELDGDKPNKKPVMELNRTLTKVYSPPFKKLMKKYNKKAYEEYRTMWSLTFQLKRCWNYHSRKLHQTVWIRLHKTVEYKARAEYVPPYRTTKTCPRCGGEVEPRNGQVVCGCGFGMNRHHSASLNIYFLSRGFSPGPLAFYRFLIRDGTRRRLAGSGVALSGCEPSDVPPMNPEGDEGSEHQEARLWANAHDG